MLDGTASRFSQSFLPSAEARDARGLQTHYGLRHSQPLAVHIQVHQREAGRTAAGGSSSIPGISLSRNQRCASGCEMDVLLSLVLAPSLDSSPFVTRPQSSCTARGG